MSDRAIDAVLFAGWPADGSSYILRDQHVIAVVMCQARSERAGGYEDGPYVGAINDHNVAVEAMRELAAVRLEWIVGRRL